ncbi:Endonuclease/exonuclease/phosphatase [Pyronema domesticum]|uniref:Similar to Inositol-1,4,5-trisphosphate 5-phosphatase 2 acc. no. Q9USQ6 n=1 Tax=Pyronema omphalodes (strain CBS 100304) TaxID=1076935 RepID=U4L6D2_PYROM|nr:Endonuclease/exonuclease/phosphatase [Pyronema domesticum]CCX12950.1 Similar to Inositol-1,4,5-trisphosphate 5-phosphatase 2; acc. no. Q9USQ6 [Pyronema omphalodes CBS 100304]
MAPTTPLTLFLLTLNCERLVQPELATALPGMLPTPAPSLLLLSLQELAPLSASFIGGTSLDPYVTTVTESVTTATEALYQTAFPLVGFHNLGMTALLVFQNPTAEVANVSWASVGLGVVGLGNKGAVAVRLEVEGRPITAVAAHLAPDEWNSEQRDHMWKKIVKECIFPDGGQVYPRDEGAMFVMGDLNYRTGESRPEQTAEERVDLDTLWEREQLQNRMKKGLTMQGLGEEEVTFPPTYKFVKNGYSKNRWPSWTDRILFLPNDGTKFKKYDAAMDYTGSDHKPVFAVVELDGTLEKNVETPFLVEPGWKSKKEFSRKGEVIVGLLWAYGIPGVLVSFALLMATTLWLAGKLN